MLEVIDDFGGAELEDSEAELIESSETSIAKGGVR
jgi:hypothetical protein